MTCTRILSMHGSWPILFLHVQLRREDREVAAEAAADAERRRATELREAREALWAREEEVSVLYTFPWYEGVAHLDARAGPLVVVH